MVSLPSSDRALGAIPRARCWERVESVAPNSWYLNLVPRDSAACAHSGRHYGERTRAVPVARTRAQELVFAGETLMRTLPALAPGNLTAVLPLQQGHPRIRTHGKQPKRDPIMQEEKKGSGSQGSQAVFSLASPRFERQPRQRARRGFERTETVRHPPSCTHRIQTGGVRTHTRPFSSTSRAHGLSSFLRSEKPRGYPCDPEKGRRTALIRKTLTRKNIHE